MNRFLAIFLALILTSISITTTGLAAELGGIRFELARYDPDRLQLSLRSAERPGRQLSSSFRLGDLAGLDRAALIDGKRSPVRFSLARDAGRLDCSGLSANRRATGTCRFTGDPAFASFLGRHGVRGASDGDLLDMTVVGTRRTLVQALSDAGYRPVSPTDLVAMTALDVSLTYIRELSASGYRPAKPGDLVALKALDVSAAYLRSLRAVGYGNIPVDEVIQLKALDVTAKFIESFQRRGYRDLPVSRLVELKALNIRPEDLQRWGRTGSGFSADELARLKVNNLLP